MTQPCPRCGGSGVVPKRRKERIDDAFLATGRTAGRVLVDWTLGSQFLHCRCGLAVALGRGDKWRLKGITRERIHSERGWELYCPNDGDVLVRRGVQAV